MNKNKSSLRSSCLRSVLDIAQINTSQDLRTYKLQKEEFKNCQAQPIKEKPRPIELRFYRILNKAQQPVKCLGFESNTTRHKREIIIHIFQVLRVTPVRFVRFCNLLTLQAPTRDQIHIASIGGIKLLPSLQQSSVLKIKA